MRQGEVKTEVQTGCVVDFGVPAAQEEGKDGQSEEEKSNNHKNSVQPLQKRIIWWRLRKMHTKKSTK